MSSSHLWSSRKPSRSTMRTSLFPPRQAWWEQRAAAQQFPPYPLSVQKLATLGALLQAGGYRAAAMYVSAAKRKHIGLGYAWSDALELEVKDGVRACLRGIGPPRKCGALDLRLLAELPDQQGPLCVGGPLWPRDGTLVG